MKYLSIIMLIIIQITIASCSSSSSSDSSNANIEPASTQEVLAKLNGKVMNKSTAEKKEDPNQSTGPSSRLSRLSQFSSSSENSCFISAPDTIESEGKPLTKQYSYNETFYLDPTDKTEYTLVAYSEDDIDWFGSYLKFVYNYLHPESCTLTYSEVFNESGYDSFENVGDTASWESTVYDANNTILDSYSDSCEILENKQEKCISKSDGSLYSTDFISITTQQQSETEISGTMTMEATIKYPNRTSWTEKFESIDFSMAYTVSMEDYSMTITEEKSDFKVTILYNEQEYNYYGTITNIFSEDFEKSTPLMILYDSTTKENIKGKITFDETMSMTVYYYNDTTEEYVLAQN